MDEGGDVRLVQSLEAIFFYFCIAGVVLFRPIIGVLQHGPELTQWLCLQRRAKRLRAARRGN